MIHADELENITDSDGKAMQFLRGNVKFRKGETTVTADRATYRDREGIGTFSPSVRMERGNQILTSDSLIFDSGNDRVTALGHVQFDDEEYDLLCDTLIYFLEADSGLGSGNVQFTQKSQTITAHRIVYQKKEGEKAASYTAIGEVVIQEEGREATCGRSIYDATAEASILLEDPVVNQEGQILSGSEIYLYYTDDILSRVVIPDQSHVTYHSTGKVRTQSTAGDTSAAEYELKEFEDDMAGKRLEAYLVDGRLDSVRLEGMATTLYHIFDDSLYQGKNIASGDTITLLFEADTAGNEDLKAIHIVGGCRGEYHPDESSSDADSPIFYSADTLHYDIPNEKTILKKSAAVDYEETQLRSGIISVSWEDNLLHALPSGEELPTVTERGRSPMVGESLAYNLSTGRGRVNYGKTRMQDGYYRGTEIRNRSNDIFLVSDGIYTTCDLEPDPHFHFESHRMKMIMSDKIIARPIVFHISGIPLFALPFAVIPDQSGKRHSGWILPSYGENGRQGQYLEGLGYFWAVNDHWNSQFTLDFYDRQGIVFRNSNRYVKRYGFSGNVRFRYNRTVQDQDIASIFGNPGAERWSLGWSHAQKLRHKQSFNVNAQYYNDSQFNRKLGIHRDTRLNQKAISNATYSKSWARLNASMSVNLRETRNLMAESKIDSGSIYYQSPKQAGMRIVETNTVLPSLTLRKGQMQLFGGSGGKTGGPSFYLSYGSTVNNRGAGFYESDSVGVDSLGNAIYEWDDKRQQTWDNSWIHNVSLSGSDRILKHIAIRPSVSLREQWTTKYFDADSADTPGSTVSKFRARHIVSFSLSGNTKLYGLFPVRIGALRAIRHTLTPSVGFSFQPDYSKPLFGYDFGYFKKVPDREGNQVLFDPFSGTAIGSTPRREQRKLNMSIKNVFQAKVGEGEEERKIDRLLTWNMSTSYNFAAETFKLSKLQSSIRAQLPRKLTLDFRMTHDFYGVNSNGEGIATNQWGIPVPRLLTASTSTGLRFSGSRLRRPERATADSDTALVDTAAAGGDLSATESMKVETVGKKPVPGGNLWALALSLRYSTNRTNPAVPRDNFWMNANLRLQLTKSWRVQYSARFDLLERDIVSHDIYVYRDLHCWELSFTWTPGGFGRGFYLRINVKAPSLRDIKVESRGGRWQGPRI
ncbi:MAG: putative LPS assembly protein LptD [Candidatus Neomarinimicrobiota bacterium]